MNTKYIILLAASLLFSSTAFSVTTNKKSSFISSVIPGIVDVTEPIPLSIPKDDKSKHQPDDWESRHQKTKSGQHHSEEDGKHHHIHFHRLTEKGRRKHILLVIAKLILIISHLSVLLYVFMHSIH
jgi:hypothetical protein